MAVFGIYHILFDTTCASVCNIHDITLVETFINYYERAERASRKFCIENRTIIWDLNILFDQSHILSVQ